MVTRAIPGQTDVRAGATPFKLEFWSDASTRAPRKHRSRYYKTSESMVRGGSRWEARGPEYWCRYWNGLHTWVSEKRRKL